MATCIYCNAQIDDGTKFCTFCGAALPVEAPEVQPVVDVEAQQAASVYTPAEQPVAQEAAQQSYQEQVQQSYQQQTPDAQQGYQQPAYGQQQTWQQQGGQQYQQPYQAQQPAGYQAPGSGAPQSIDSGNIGWGILGFFFPIVGLILFLVWRESKPNSAKVAGIGAIIGFALGLLTTFML